MSYEILLYYRYTSIDDPEQLRDAQRALCTELGLTGRIIVAHEGINGTVEGTSENTARYMDAMYRDSRFANLWFKRSPGTGTAFPKLSVKVRPELVSAHFGDDDIDPNQVTGKRLSADALHDWFVTGKEFYIVDMRNDYEHISGHFAGSVLPKLTNFRDLPTVLTDLKHLKDKTVLTVCTGGVRCEKASGFLVKHGFTDVYQLDGGIVTYMEKYPNQNFQGKLYVFDGRITMGFNTDSPDHIVIGRCEHCGKACDSYVNCANERCHKHYICCADCRDEAGTAFCSEHCEEIVKKALVASSIS